MKILIPFQDPFDRHLRSPICSGGIENFCKSIQENYETIIYQVPIKQISWPQNEKVEIAKHIVNLAKSYEVDVIISNFDQAIYNSQHLIKSQIPIMFAMHTVYPIPNGIYRWNQGIERGHSLFFVSEWQQKKYKEMAKRTGQPVIKHAGYITPSYIKEKKEIPDEHIYDCGTIGRCDSGKNPLKNLTNKTDLKTLVITSDTHFEKDKKYYETNKKKYFIDNKWIDVTWNEPYKKVIEDISKCKTYFSTWSAETWGITSMEALSCGVPVILNADKDGDHASTIIPADKEHYKLIPHDDKDELLKAIKSFENVDRKAIQQATWEKHNKKAWKKQFENCVDKTVENFSRKSDNSKAYWIS